jgi:hypothetical protein
MTEPAKTMQRYVVGGFTVLCLAVLLVWLAVREGPSPASQRPVMVEPPKPHAQEVLTEFERAAARTNAATQADVSATTNAAALYHQAFDLFNALSDEQKAALGDWRTNVDAATEAELCEKMRPICDLLHQASAVTNCDWGTDLLTFSTPLPHLSQARRIARAAMWNAAHCRSNDVAGATDDALSVLQLGHAVSHTVILGCLMDIAIQDIASSYVAQHIESFGADDGQRLSAAFDDPSYGEVPSQAFEQEADEVEREAAKLATLSEYEANKELSALIEPNETRALPARDAAVAALEQIASFDQGIAKALGVSLEDGYDVSQRDWAELQASNPLAGDFFGGLDQFVDRACRAEVNRALLVAGLAVAQDGVDALESYPDPASGESFAYTETAAGFELQSTYQMNGKPMTMQFK